MFDREMTRATVTSRDGREPLHYEQDRNDDPCEGMMRELNLRRDEERELVVDRDRIYEPNVRTAHAGYGHCLPGRPEHDVAIDHDTGQKDLHDEGLVVTLALGSQASGPTLPRESRSLLDSHSTIAKAEPLRNST